MPTKHIHDFVAQRIIVETPVPFEEVCARLDKHLNRDTSRVLGTDPFLHKPSVGSHDPLTPQLRKIEKKGELLSELDSLLGGKPFLFVGDLDHSVWLNAYFDVTHEEKPRSVMYLYGNPNFAQRMLRNDPTCGLHVPHRLLVIDSGRKGAQIVYVRQSTLMLLGEPDEDLIAAGTRLDEKVEQMVTAATRVEPALAKL